METVNIPQEIKTIRTSLGLTQRQLGELIGKKRQLIADVENSRQRLDAEDYVKIRALKEQAKQ